MGTAFCDNCGTSIEEKANFCRACGTPTPLSEAATRKLDERAKSQIQTSPVASSFTTPAYLAPLDFLPAPQTNDLTRAKQKRNLVIAASLLGAMVLMLACLLFFLNLRPGTPAGTPTVPAAPGASAPPVLPVPPIPPAPPAPTKIDQSVIYPGSKQTMSLADDDGNPVVLNLHSDDAPKKVADWYIATLKATKKVSIAGQTILRAGTIGIVIVGGDGGTQILITRGDEDSNK